MKKLLVFLMAAGALTTACKKDDFLEPKTSALTEDTVFGDSTRTMAFLARIYGDIGYTFNKGRWSSHGNTEQVTDDAEYLYSGGGQSAVQLYSGSLSPLTFYGNVPSNDFWQVPWDNIRRVNLLMSELPRTPLSKAKQARMVAEARFLRAWYYHCLLSHYGGVPIINDQVFGLEDFINLPRTSYADCVTYLIQELDAVAAVLPDVNGYPAADYGRVTRGAALGLKSRLLLYAASPLFNGGAETSDASLASVVSYPSASVARWQAAADAAAALMTGPDAKYALNVDNTTAPGYGFYNVFLLRQNTEYIFFVNRAPNRDMEVFYNPPSRGGQTNSTPTQNLVDAFPMKNGLPISAAGSGYVATNPYANRDPRFYNSILYNSTAQTPCRYFLTTANAQSEVFTYEGAASDGINISNSSTGYFSRKMCDVNIAANSGTNTQRGWPLMRYAEILLNYAEAINEAGQPALAYPALIQLRTRAGIEPGTNGQYGLTPGLSQAQMRDLIRNERRVELANEDHRWNDIRRWKIAMVTNNAFNNRMRIVRAGTSPNFTYTYNVVPTIRRHNFRPEMYLLPIPDSEIRKVPLMRQNPGW
ncbi:RagB/SusD family nutrient uptake outer membrane protein [Hymenobacter sp. M29]|uniref:RagB/SusD family nutrient uptake outer membrane protein n=1 Tax=Hymenobacter mellowenesis TaxID=3063995 RepID=A0ABT9A6R2_9BACT|nr:RagB/SusD family nutrient uptake outer membrane protein [Hymenobacter sp. M29]MDO7845521.1 RagB/SusD family nutrient uptake outer membrane protein [Hymenobacter sp. M29]